MVVRLTLCCQGHLRRQSPTLRALITLNCGPHVHVCARPLNKAGMGSESSLAPSLTLLPAPLQQSGMREALGNCEINKWLQIQSSIKARTNTSPQLGDWIHAHLPAPSLSGCESSGTSHVSLVSESATSPRLCLSCLPHDHTPSSGPGWKPCLSLLIPSDQCRIPLGSLPTCHLILGPTMIT